MRRNGDSSWLAAAWKPSDSSSVAERINQAKGCQSLQATLRSQIPTGNEDTELHFLLSHYLSSLLPPYPSQTCQALQLLGSLRGRPLTSRAADPGTGCLHKGQAPARHTAASPGCRPAEHSQPFPTAQLHTWSCPSARLRRLARAQQRRLGQGSKAASRQ